MQRNMKFSLNDYIIWTFWLLTTVLIKDLPVGIFVDDSWKGGLQNKQVNVWRNIYDLWEETATTEVKRICTGLELHIQKKNLF